MQRRFTVSRVNLWFRRRYQFSRCAQSAAVV